MKFTPQDNSFGIDVKDMSFVFDLLEQSKDDLDFQGFSFYLRTANEEQRIVAFENQMSLTFEAIRRGFQIRTVNIGGGFSIAYADDRAEWNAYIERLKEAALHKIESQTWNNTGLGFSMQDGFLKGAPIFNDHCPARTKGEELDHWLSLRLPDHGNAAFGDLVRDSLLELAIEPGMGMLDQCGVTLGDVNFIKESTWGEKIIGLKMNRSNLHSTHQKILTEPVILMRDPLNNPVDERGVYYLGNLCLSYDILRDNRTYPERTPMQGDVVAFMNTAAYGMDFIESESLMQPTAQKVALYEREGAMRWALDENYMPVNLPMGGAL